MFSIIRMVLLSVLTFTLTSCVSFGTTIDANVLEYEKDKVFKKSIADKTVLLLVKCFPIEDPELSVFRVPTIVGGTGVILRSSKERSYVLTAHHVVVREGYFCIPLVYKSSDRKRENPLAATTVLFDKSADLALLLVSANLKENSKIARDAYIGQKLVVAGYPSIRVRAKGTNSEDLSISINSGEYATELYGKDGTLFLFRMTCDVFSGYSGGAVFDMKGNIVGITSFMIAVSIERRGKTFLFPRAGYYFASPYNKIRSMIVVSKYGETLAIK